MNRAQRRRSGWGRTSGRSKPLPPKREWNPLREEVLKRAGYQCQAIQEDTGERCKARATQVDHMGAADDHRIENLQALCARHHARKTSRETRQKNLARLKANTKKSQLAVDSFAAQFSRNLKKNLPPKDNDNDNRNP